MSESADDLDHFEFVLDRTAPLAKPSNDSVAVFANFLTGQLNVACARSGLPFEHALEGVVLGAITLFACCAQMHDNEEAFRASLVDAAARFQTAADAVGFLWSVTQGVLTKREAAACGGIN